jgi:hypothetical protein
MCQFLIGPCVNDWTSVKSTNGQLTDGLIWLFIKTTWISRDKNQTIREKNKVVKPQWGIRYLTLK